MRRPWTEPCWGRGGRPEVAADPCLLDDPAAGEQPSFRSALPDEDRNINICLNLGFPLSSGTRGGRVGEVSERVLPAHAGSGPGGAPLCSAARHHGGPRHRTSPAGALCPATLPADSSLPEGQPPLFTHSPGSGQSSHLHLLYLLYCKDLSGHLCSRNKHFINDDLIYLLTSPPKSECYLCRRLAAGIWRVVKYLPFSTGCCTSTTGETHVLSVRDECTPAFFCSMLELEAQFCRLPGRGVLKVLFCDGKPSRPPTS